MSDRDLRERVAHMALRHGMFDPGTAEQIFNWIKSGQSLTNAKARKIKKTAGRPKKKRAYTKRSIFWEKKA